MAPALMADRLDSTHDVVVIGATASHHDDGAAIWGGRPNVVVLDHLPSDDYGHAFFRGARSVGVGWFSIARSRLNHRPMN